MSLRSIREEIGKLPGPVQTALQSRIAGEVELPLLPDTAMRVMAACQDEATNLQTLADLITQDQSLAVHLLRVANSAAYAPRGPIVSIQQAIGRLGVLTVSEIAIAVSLKGRAFIVPGYLTRVRELWMHSAAAATYAKEVATTVRKGIDSAFLCGLLHDVGMPIAMQLTCDLAREQGQDIVPAPIMEAAMREFHVELGTKIAQRWRLAPEIVSVMRFHHDPASAPSQQDEVLVAYLADRLAYWALDEEQDKKDFTLDLPKSAPWTLSLQQVENLLAKRGRVLEVTEAFL